MGTLTVAVIFTIIGAAIGAYIMNQMRKENKAAADFDRKFNERVPTEALKRAKVAKMDPVLSDPDVGYFFDDIRSEKDKDAERMAALAKKASKIKDEDAAELYHLIAKLGTDAWISKATVKAELGWEFARYKAALNYLERTYLERGRYIKPLESHATNGTKYEAVV